MPEETTNDALLEDLIARLGMHASEGVESLLSQRTIRETAYHDFFRHEYLVEPWTEGAGGSDALIDALAAAAGSALPPVLVWAEFEGTHDGPSSSAEQLDREGDPLYSDAGLARRMIEGDGFRNGALPVTDEIVDLRSDTAHQDAAGAALIEMLAELVAGTLENDVAGISPSRTQGLAPGDIDTFIDDVDRWREMAEMAVGVVEDSGPRVPFVRISEPFDGFATGSVNVGLRTVFRQVWSPLGLQAGEIVRTLPLGPKQTEKVTVKIMRRRATARSSERSRLVETTTEEGSTTTDSSEIVRDTAESSNWHAEASVSGGFGGFGAEVTAGAGGERSESTKDAKSVLNESMASTASKVQTETKVVVSTETEEQTERTRVSEITNPNDEVAVTYVYSRLQQQYELSTYLQGLDTVLYVAEHLPRPAELDASWFRLHGWILAEVLLDGSVADDLARVVEGATSTSGESVDPRVDTAMEKLEALPDYSGTSGTPPDFISTVQATYEREVERSRGRGREASRFQHSLRRLREHVSANLLHYMRAIWSAEDQDTRMMRLRRVRVPVDWLAAMHTEARYVGALNVQLSPAAMLDEDGVPFSELVDPAGPIGYSGNYSVWLLRDERKAGDLAGLLAMMRLPYLRLVLRVEGGERFGSAFDVWAAARPDTVEEATYRAEIVEGPELELRKLRSSGTVFQGRKDVHPAGGMVEVGPLRIHLRPLADGRLEVGDAFTIHVGLAPELEDPEIRQVRWEQRGPSDAEADTFTDETIAAMATHDERVAEALEGVEDPSWETLGRSARRVLRDRWAHEVLRRRYTRRLLLETNNVLLTRVVDQSSSLEPFKMAHRYVDVLKAHEELKQAEAEADRLRGRIEGGELGDPDTERTVIVDGASVVVGPVDD